MNCKQNEPLPPSPTLVATERMSSRSKGNTAEQAAKEQAGQVDVSPGKLALLASLEDEPAKAEVTPQEVAEGGNGIAVPPADPVQNLVSNVLQNAVVESAPAAPAAAPRSLQKTESWLVRDSDTARKKIEDALKMQSVGFDGAGNKNVQRSPNGVPQSWNLQSLDPRRAASNQATMDKIAEILHEHPELHCDCHGRTDADATKKADPVLARYFGVTEMQAIQDLLAENRANACRDALIQRGVEAERLTVSFKGCGGESKVDFFPMTAKVAASKAQAAPAAAEPIVEEEAVEEEEDSRFKDVEEFAKLVKMEKEMAAAQVQALARGNKARSDVDLGPPPTEPPPALPEEPARFTPSSTSARRPTIEQQLQESAAKLAAEAAAAAAEEEEEDPYGDSLYGGDAYDDDEEEEDTRFKDVEEFAKLVKMEKDLAAAQVQALQRGKSTRDSLDATDGKDASESPDAPDPVEAVVVSALQKAIADVTTAADDTSAAEQTAAEMGATEKAVAEKAAAEKAAAEQEAAAVKEEGLSPTQTKDPNFVPQGLKPTDVIGKLGPDGLILNDGTLKTVKIRPDGSVMDPSSPPGKQKIGKLRVDDVVVKVPDPPKRKNGGLTEWMRIHQVDRFFACIVRPQAPTVPAV